MDEPQRIGLTKPTNQKLEDMLESLNSGNQGKNLLIKKDLYRLAIALGVKGARNPPAVTEKTDDFLRVVELDEDKGLYTAVSASGLCEVDEPVYQTIERLAEYGIRDIYEAYRENMDEIPWDKVLG